VANERAAAPPPQLPNLAFQQFLASGGFADVYLYEQEFPRQRVAVKVLRQRRGSLDRDFVNEANRLAGLSEHPNIVRISAANISGDGRAYMVMEYCPPPHLGVRCRPHGLPVDEALRIGVKVCGAVSAAHHAGILHRDLKPANILMRASKEPVLIDFGIAGERRGAEVDEGAGVSVPYAAPEVLFSDAPGDEVSDVYSLGATLYALVAGRSPFEVPGGDNTQDGLLARMRVGSAQPTGKPGVPAGLEALLQYALARQPGARPQSAAALARALQEVERGLGYRPTDFFDGTVPTTPEPTRRGPDDPDGTRAQIQVVAPERSTSNPASLSSVPSRPSPPSAPAHGPAPQTPAPWVEVPDALTGSRAGGVPVPEGLEAQTQHRARPAPVSEPVVGDDRGAAPFPLRVVAAVVLVVAVLAVVIASVVGGSSGSGDDATTSTTGSNQLAQVEPVAEVTAERVGSAIHVSWVDDGNPAGTSYVVSYDDASGTPQQRSTEATSIVIDDAPTSRACIIVEPFAPSGLGGPGKQACVEAGGA
jgi:serine/threonine protein kinase